jgi:PhzF family phenazine biosynthesis protein
MPREIPLYQVDAFTGRLFAGNPAAICPLNAWIDAGTMQAIAAENNLSETAFFTPAPGHGPGHYDLRWFTPAAEVDLCGHATLASAFVLFTELTPHADEVRFHTRSGELVVRREGSLLAMDFPVRPLAPHPRMKEAADDLGRALGGAPSEILCASYLLGLHESEEAVRALAPDYARLGAALERAEGWAYIATARARPGADYDFVSRFFAPLKGVPEDPVTGSAHCLLAPYWAERLGRTAFTGFQASSRGGYVLCEYDAAKRPDRVTLRGACVLYLRGRIVVD